MAISCYFWFFGVPGRSVIPWWPMSSPMKIEIRVHTFSLFFLAHLVQRAKMSITSDLGKFQYLKKPWGRFPITVRSQWGRCNSSLPTLRKRPPANAQKLSVVRQPTWTTAVPVKSTATSTWVTVNSQLAGNYAATQTTSGAQWETKKPSIRTFIIIILHGLFTLFLWVGTRMGDSFQK